MKVLIATHNKGKLKEIKHMLEGIDIELVMPSDIGIDISKIEENGSSFLENAKIKAYEAYKLGGIPTLADDSGLVIDALNGAPGIYSARYAGENATDKDKINKVLSELKNAELKDRTARFVCAVCLKISDEKEITVQGSCEGSIALEPFGDGGFGYDPIFLTEDGTSFAAIDSNKKDEISHRGNAFNKLKIKLKEYIENGE